jgi:hypothetical protein
MGDVTIKELNSQGRHVVIVRREDGIFSFRCLFEGAPGPYCGLYDSAETAETEARSRFPRLNLDAN